MIQTETACLEWTATGAVSYYPDGRMWGALPHPELPSYHIVAARCGYGSDLLRYAREHELAHHLCGELFGHPSKVLWALAHSKQPSAYEAASEEALALALQRYARTNEHPMIDRVDWDALKTRFLELGNRP